MESTKLKVAIADDEILIISMIRKMIDFDRLDMEVVGECTTGTGLLKLIQEKKPDIVITDICMPGCDGLEMIRQANKMEIVCEYILISGHKNFEYAHTAVKYGIRNYLLKPLNQTELYDNIKDVKQRILEKRNSDANMLLLQDRSKKSERISNKYFMQDLLNNSLQVENRSMKSINEYYMTRFQKNNLVLIIVKPDLKYWMNPDQYSIILEQVDDYFRRNIQIENIYSISQITNQIYIMVDIDAVEELENTLLDLLENAKVRFRDYCMLTLGVSQPYRIPGHEMVVEAETAIHDRLDKGANRIMHFTKGASDQKEDCFSIHALNVLRSYIEIANRQACQTWMDRQKKLVSQGIAAAVYMKKIYELVDIICTGLKKLFKTEEEFGREQIREQIFHSTTRQDILTNVKCWLDNELASYIEQNDNQKQWYIRMAKKYIKENYNNNITLNDVAYELHLNAAYLSAIFKRIEGVNFSNYLISYRMELAKGFLKEPVHSIGEVGEMIGYEDTSYFSKLFKRIVGVRPKEYRKLYL